MACCIIRKMKDRAVGACIARPVILEQNHIGLPTFPLHGSGNPKFQRNFGRTANGRPYRIFNQIFKFSNRLLFYFSST